MSYTGCQTDVLIGKKEMVTDEMLETAMNNAYGEGTATVRDGEGTLIVKYTESGREYTISNDGKVVAVEPEIDSKNNGGNEEDEGNATLVDCEKCVDGTITGGYQCETCGVISKDCTFSGGYTVTCLGGECSYSYNTQSIPTSLTCSRCGRDDMYYEESSDKFTLSCGHSFEGHRLEWMEYTGPCDVDGCENGLIKISEE